MANDVQAFISAIDDECGGIQRVYTTSAHGKAAQKAMNELWAEHPRYRNALLMLSVHPLQTWAARTRKALSLDLSAISSAMQASDEVFGLRAEYTMSAQVQALSMTDKALAVIDEALANPALTKNGGAAVRAIHMEGAPDVSKYLVQTAYKKALEKLCASLWRRLDPLTAQINDTVRKSAPDIQIAYHNMQLLLLMGPQLLDESFQRRSDVDYYDTCVTILECIDQIAGYPFGGEDISAVIMGSFHGLSKAKIAKKLGKSWTYVDAKYNEGTDVMTYLIWGYTAPQILEAH